MPIFSTAVTTDPNDVATSSSHVVTPDGGLQDVPSIRDFLNKICVELKRPPEFLESIVSAFQSEDVSSVNLLVALFGVQAQYTAMKTAVQESGLKVSAMFWALLETQLTPFIESSRPSQGPSQRRRVSTGSTGEGIGRDVNQALRAGAEAGKSALSLGYFVRVMKHACLSLSPFVVYVFDRFVLLFASSFHSWSRGAWYLSVGWNERHLCSKVESLPGERRFWLLQILEH